MPKRIQRRRTKGQETDDLWQRRTHSNPAPTSRAPLRVPEQPLLHRADGLTPEEGRVMDHLAAAASFFGDLPLQHPSELREFVDGIDRLRDLLALRIAWRQYPEGWRNDADPS